MWIAERGLRRTRFVGRDAELARIVEVLALPPAFVLVEGEGGIGKSRLVREAIRAVDPEDVRTLYAQCPPFVEGFTLGPLVDAVRQAAPDIAGLGLSALSGVLRPLFPEWADALPPAPQQPADPDAVRHQLIRALADLVDRLGVRVLVVEDVHWADAATLDFLVHLSTRRPRPPGLVLTCRPSEVPPGSPLRRLTSRPADGVSRARVVLEGLPLSESAALVSSMLDGGRASAELAGYLHDRTEGVPLALEECVRLLRDRNDLALRDGEWTRRCQNEIAVPATIRDAVGERVARLAPDARHVLLAAAVLADPVDERTLAAVSALPPARWLAALGQALASGLLDDTQDAHNGTPASHGRFFYRHVLAARAVYEQAPAHERRGAHRRAGEVLEATTPPPVVRLAHHFRLAGEFDRWSGYARQAVDLALVSGNPTTAMTLLHALITDPALPPAEAAALTGRLPLYTSTGDPRQREIIQSLRSVLASEGLDVHERAAVRAQLGRLLVVTGEHTRGAAELELAIPDLAHGGYAVASTMALLGIPVHESWPIATHLRWLKRAESVASAGTVSADEARTLHVDRATALLDLGERSGWELARRFDADPSNPRTGRQVARLLLNLGSQSVNWGRYEDARRHLAGAVEIAERHGYLRLRDMALVTRDHLDWFTGAWDGLDERVASWGEVGEEPLIRMDSQQVAAMLRSARSGPDSEVLRMLGTVREESARRGAMNVFVESAGALGRVAGHPAKTLEATKEPVRRMVRKGVWLWAADLLPPHLGALLALGHRAEAEALTATFAEGARGREIPVLTATLASCRALLAEGGGRAALSAAAWQAAAEAWLALPRPYHAALAREHAARWLLAAGQPGAAVRELRAALEEFTALGARHDAERARRALAELGEREGERRAGRRGYGDRLSPREQEVVRLVVRGLTNRQIAEILSRSPKTVATQVNSAMRKHGVSSRTALAVRIAQRGYGDGPPGSAPD